MGRRCSWTPAEDAILRATYPTQGSRGTSHALTTAGHSRSPKAVRARAHHLNASRQRPPRPPRPPARPRVTPARPPVMQLVLDIITDYRGLPLSVADVSEELDVNPAGVTYALKRLTARGVIRSRYGDSRHRLYYREPSCAP